MIIQFIFPILKKTTTYINFINYFVRRFNSNIIILLK